MEIIKGKQGTVLGGRHAVRISALLCLVVLALPAQGTASDPFSTDHADVVVEGDIILQEVGSGRDLPTYVGDGDIQIRLKLGEVLVSRLRVTRVYKGDIEPGKVIAVYTSRKTTDQNRGMYPDKRYLLMLKKHPAKSGYYLAGHGKAGWRVFDYNGRLKVMPWYQYRSVRDGSSYQDYEAFTQQFK